MFKVIKYSNKVTRMEELGIILLWNQKLGDTIYLLFCLYGAL